MADSDSSSLSSAPSTDDEEMALKMMKPTGLDRYFKPVPKSESTPEPPKRAPSPPHEYTLADNEAIPFLVMLRSRFHDAFPKSLPHYGPQDIERGVSGELPDDQVERLLCNLLGLVLNRKKDVERGHYGRALEEAVASNQNQWPTAWKGVNPLHGGKNFNNMTPEERLTLLKALALWALNSSDTMQALIKESYKQTRRDDDRNQPRSVQPWFSDSYRRKYWLIEGLEDSHFRIYRENDGKTAKTNTWFSVAGTIDEVNALADKFAEEHTQNSKVISDKLRSAIPRFEAGEEKRRRRDYRMARKVAFARPEPGFSLYEGRTRGKRMRYTYDDDEDDGSDAYSSRRSTRMATPVESGPTITASGRQVKSRVGGLYGESMLTDQRKELERAMGEGEATETSDDMPATIPNGRVMRTARSGRIVKSTSKMYNAEPGSDSEEAQLSGNEWSGNEDEPDESEPDFDAGDEDEDEDEDEEMMSDDGGLDPDELAQAEEYHNDTQQQEGEEQDSLVVQLRYRKEKGPAPVTAGPESGGVQQVQNHDQRTVNGINEAEQKGVDTPVGLPGTPFHQEPVRDDIKNEPNGKQKLSSETTARQNGLDSGHPYSSASQPQPAPPPPPQPMDVS